MEEVAEGNITEGLRPGVSVSPDGLLRHQHRLTGTLGQYPVCGHITDVLTWHEIWEEVMALYPVIFTLGE